MYLADHRGIDQELYEAPRWTARGAGGRSCTSPSGHPAHVLRTAAFADFQHRQQRHGTVPGVPERLNKSTIEVWTCTCTTYRWAPAAPTPSPWRRPSGSSNRWCPSSFCSSPTLQQSRSRRVDRVRRGGYDNASPQPARRAQAQARSAGTSSSHSQLHLLRLFTFICIFPFYYLFIHTISRNSSFAGTGDALSQGHQLENYVRC